jgi:hypothetical protein
MLKGCVVLFVNNITMYVAYGRLMHGLPIRNDTKEQEQSMKCW